MQAGLVRYACKHMMVLLDGQLFVGEIYLSIVDLLFGASWYNGLYWDRASSEFSAV